MQNVNEHITESESGACPCGAERGRSPSEAPQGHENGSNRFARYDSEVKPHTKRRRFSVSYKLEILSELDSCKTTTEEGAVIRREGIYASQISKWRKQRRDGTLNLSVSKRGQKVIKTKESEKIEALERENNNLRNQLKQAEMIIGVQKKVSELFGGVMLESCVWRV
jgi:transposase